MYWFDEPVGGFLPRSGQSGRIGFLLSTSSGRESHEWEGVQAGVFSHEVRSGLYGAADVETGAAVDDETDATFRAGQDRKSVLDRIVPGY